MILFAFIIGFALPVVTGWLLVSAVEGGSPVLGRIERWAYAGLLGPGVTMLLSFIASVGPGIPLNRLGYLAIHCAALAGAYMAWKMRVKHLPSALKEAKKPLLAGLPPVAAATVLVLMVWTAVKIIVPGVTFLMLTPTFLDDTLDNWNMRGKVFMETQAYTVELPRIAPEALQASVSSYPPAVPLFKAWLATLAGTWNEGLVNIPHLFWFLIAIALVACAVRRKAGPLWAILSVYLLVSLPLYLMHGTNSYADGFLSAHVAAGLLPVVFALWEEDAARRMAWFRLGAVMTAILIFAKNEASVLYLPPLLLMTGATLTLLRQRKQLTWDELKSVILWYGGSMALLALPWLSYKWLHGFAFGNAKQLSSLDLQWHSGVAIAIFINTYFEGNWILLFPLTIGLVAMRWKTILRSPLLIVTAFIAIVYVLQLFVFFFTPLAYEAIKQTGYARGLVHIMPLMVILTTLLLKDVLKNLVPEWLK